MPSTATLKNLLTFPSLIGINILIPPHLSFYQLNQISISMGLVTVTPYGPLGSLFSLEERGIHALAPVGGMSLAG
jgi:hypothetical protein